MRVDGPHEDFTAHRPAVEASAQTTWTLRELLHSPPPVPEIPAPVALDVVVYLERVAGGHTAMGELGGVLYVSRLKADMSPNDWDRQRAAQLGFTLTT